MQHISFDFGKKAPVDGFIKINEQMVYDESKGYGLSAPAEAVERKTGAKDLCRDFLLMGGKEFKVKLDNGIYMVRIYSGDYVDEGDVTTNITVNGQAIHFWVYDGKITEKVIETEVTDGVMTFSVDEGRHPCLNAVEISPKRDIPFGSISCTVTAKADKQSVNLSWDKLDGVCGYRVIRQNMQNREFDREIDVITEEFTDMEVRLAERYKYTVYGLYGYKFFSQPSETLDIVVKNGEEPSKPVENLHAGVTENTVALSWDKVEDAVWYNVYQKAPYGIYKKLCETEETEYIDSEVIVNAPFIYAVEAITPAGAAQKAEIKIEPVAPSFKPKMETLDRGAVAVKTDSGVFLSWRLNGWEYKKDIDFVIERNGELITEKPLTDSTNYLDKEGNVNDTYTIKAVHEGKAEKTGAQVKVWEKPYLSIPLDKPAPAHTPDGNIYQYTANDAAVADLDGDGEYEIILRWDANGKDNSHKGYTGKVLLDAYKLNGTKLWRIDLGVNIRAGSHYTQVMAYDFNNDGKAEVICKTADGTVDGVGNVIGDKDADYRNKDGFILEGPEYLTVFDGTTGAAIDTTDYEQPRGDVSEWGDSWGNRVDRFLACVAYLDGVNPSVVMCRGYYDHGCPTALVAYDMIDNRLVKRWKFLANSKQNIEYTNQGNHNLGVGDIDGDGRDEIVYGAMAVDHDGTGIYSTGLEHGDCMNLGKFMPDSENLDFFQIHEHEKVEYGFEVRNPATGEISWGRYTGRDTTRGLCAKIDPRYKGNQVWVMDDGIYTFDGQLINEKGPDSINFAIWWDGDLIRELLDHEFDKEKKVGYPKIYKWDYENNRLVTILDPVGTLSNNWMKGTPCIQADILGDWREEVVWRNEDSTELRLYTTTDLTDKKFYTLMHDHVYRMSVAWQNTAYNQCPQTGFYIGPDMIEEPPVPEAEYVRGEIVPDFTEKL